MMNISVVIPTYNRVELLKRSIDSVINQTIKPFEIIIVDDGSNDGTEAMVKKKYDSLIKVSTCLQSKAKLGSSKLCADNNSHIAN